MIKSRRREKPLPTRLRETSSGSDDVGLALRRAINNDELWPAFQPLVDLKSGAIVGFEVLARWTNSEGNVIPPSIFIPIAERDALIDALTQKIVSDACRQAAAWQGTLILAVNISPTQFRDPNLSASFVKAVQATGLACASPHGRRPRGNGRLSTATRIITRRHRRFRRRPRSAPAHRCVFSHGQHRC